MNIWERLEAKLGINLNEKYLTIGLVPLVCYLIYAAMAWGSASMGNIIGMAAGVGFNLTIFFVFMLASEFFLMGVGFDTREEIKKGNVAMAIAIASLRIGSAIVIAKGIV